MTQRGWGRNGWLDPASLIVWAVIVLIGVGFWTAAVWFAVTR